MRIFSITNNGINFGRAFSLKEREEADKMQKEALKLLDCDKVIVIVPEASFPSEAGKDIGIGQLNSKSNDKFYDFLKTYTGANSIKVLPQGEYVKSRKNFFCNYRTSALTLGTHLINLKELASDKMGNILSKETLNSVYEESSKKAHFENVVGKNSKHGKALEEAYNNFVNSTLLDKEKKLFENYKRENAFVEKRAFFEALANEYGDTDFTKWQDVDKNLFNPDIISEEVRETRIKEIKSKYSREIDFTFFKQYLADKNLSNARKQMHDKGLTLTGDCLIGFSTDELWAYPRAFEKATIASKDWGLRALNYADLLKDGSESNKLFKLKIENFAKRYDNIRFDVGWAYINPILYAKDADKDLMNSRYRYDEWLEGYRTREPLGEKVLNIIEDIVKNIKGENYKKENLLYEIEANPKEFTAYDWNKKEVIDALKDRTIVQSTFYMDEGYGTVEQLENMMKVPRDNYVIMAGNHDHVALQNLAHKNDSEKILESFGNNISEIYRNQISVLSKKFGIDRNILESSPEEFVKAKFGYNFLAKNIKMFFMDIFGRSEQFDAQKNNSTKNYRDRLTSDYEREFHKAVQEKRGLNIMDAISKAMKAKGLDKSYPEVYEKIIKLRDILYEKGAMCEEEANKLFNEAPAVKNGVEKGGKKLWIWVSAAFAAAALAGIAIKKALNKKSDEIQKA